MCVSVCVGGGGGEGGATGKKPYSCCNLLSSSSRLLRSFSACSQGHEHVNNLSWRYHPK